jgi:transcriptional regulator with XRE-family HTH domain
VAQVCGGFLADMRKKVGLTQAEVAEAMGCHRHPG